MRIVDAVGSKFIELGRLGEHQHTTVRFPESTEYLNMYPNATVCVLNRRPGDPGAYPVDPLYVRSENGVVQWEIQNADLIRDGKGQCELIFIQDQTIAKSLIYMTTILKSLDGTETPPEPWEEWVERVVRASENAPYIEDGTWYVWDPAEGGYVDTGINATGPKGDKGDKGDTGNGIESTVLNNDYSLTVNFTDGDSYTTRPIRGATGNGIESVVINNDDTMTITFTDGNTYTTIPLRGYKGDKGDPFTVKKTFPSVEDMEEYTGTDVVEGDFVMITSTVEDPDNAKLYVKSASGYTFITDLSGTQGMKGDTGNGIASITQNPNYTLTIVYTNGSSVTTSSIRGAQGPKGDTGEVGETGTGIESIVLNADYTLTIYLDDGTDYTTDPIRGEKGDKGDPFYIVKTYATIAAMEADFSGTDVAVGDYVMISSNVDDPDNAKVYEKGSQAWEFIADMSGPQGIQGETGDTAVIVSQVTAYQNSESGTVIPTGEWSNVQPTTPQGSFLWIRYTLTWNNGQTTVMYSVSRMGIDGSGSVVGATINGESVSPDSQGILDFGTVIRSHQDISGKLDINQGTANKGKIIRIDANGNLAVDKTMVILSYGSSTWQDFITAYNSSSVIYCRASSDSNPATGSQTRLAFMAYVNNAETPTEVEFQYYRSVSSHTSSQQGDQVFVYKLTSSAGWTVTTREASSKIVAGTNMDSSYINGTLTLSAIVPDISGKVDKIPGKDLSTNDYTDAEKAKVDSAVQSSEKGVAGGVAVLDSNGMVPSGELPSYVDDIIEGYYYEGKFYQDNMHITEIVGETGKIYVDLGTEKTYRWSGTTFVEISAGMKVLSVQARAEDWTETVPPTNTITADGVTASNYIIVGTGGSLTERELTEIQDARIVCTGQRANAIVLTAYGDVPDIDIPVTVGIVG